jgi:hypothetical protein
MVWKIMRKLSEFVVHSSQIPEPCLAKGSDWNGEKFLFWEQLGLFTMRMQGKMIKACYMTEVEHACFWSKFLLYRMQIHTLLFSRINLRFLFYKPISKNFHPFNLVHGANLSPHRILSPAVGAPAHTADIIPPQHICSSELLEIDLYWQAFQWHSCIN